MDLIAIAVPFFLLALLLEMALDRRRGTARYRSDDAINSISAGMLDTTTDYSTKFLPLIGWGYVMQHWALSLYAACFSVAWEPKRRNKVLSKQ